jgi:toxin ParE1/3/4
MNYQLLISDESRLDILDAFSWHEIQREGLGKDFELCLEAGLHELQRNPMSFQKKYREVHVYYITRFPYGVYYLVDANRIKVMAVSHTSRKPQSWVKRLS